MLSLHDFREENWPGVTWQILTHNYAWGSAYSEVLPPGDYLEWMMRTFALNNPGSVKISSHISKDETLCWQIIIKEAYEHGALNVDYKE
jgi:hypothetical protein